MIGRQESRFQTEVEFTLPRGYLGSDGLLHRQGMMRLATAADEILPLRDPRVQQNPAYLAIIVLARVITKLGGVTDLDTKTIEGLYAADLDYLQRLYERINSSDEVDVVPATAPPAAMPAAGLRNGAAPSARGFRGVGES